MATVNGTTGNDNLNGTSGNDTLNGLGGSDTLVGSGGTDFYDGGAGIDTLDLRLTATGVAVSFAAGTISGGFNGTFVNIERVLGSNGADSLIGAAGNQNFSGRGGNDTLAGGVGNDTLWGGGGDADSFVFRETGTANADNIADFTSGADKIVLDARVMTALGANGNFAAGDARFVANATGTAQDSSDRVIFNTTTRQVLYDADGSGSGAAVLIATLQSGATLAATDIVVEGGGTGGPQPINGTSGNDSLVGGAGNDTINGLDGNDIIDGRAGADSMVGGAGDDTYFVDNPGDMVVESSDGGFDTVNAGVTYTLPAFVNHLTLTGTAAINGTGNEAANAITGNSAGNVLAGGAGADTLSGGSGADRFVFREFGAANADRIADFASASDKIVLDARVMTALGANGNFAAGDARFVANSTGTAQDSSDRVVFNTTTQQLFYDADGSGSGAAQLVATVQGSPAVAATDIVVENGTSQATPFSPGVVSSYEYSSDHDTNTLLAPMLTKWGTGGTGTGASLTYSFRSEASVYSYSFEPGQPGWVPWTEAEKQAIRDALQAFAEVANLQFTEVTDSANVAGDLRFGTTVDLPGTIAWAHFPTASASAGDTWYDNEFLASDADPSAGSRSFQVFLHEIGHALGLKHSFESPFVLAPSKDTHDYTVMAAGFRKDGFGSFPETPMLLDVAAVQHIYGANMATRAGNDVYSWAVGEHFYRTLWDAGGNDMIDWSNQSSAARIDLNPGAWSEIGPERGDSMPTQRNLAIAFGATIENANGGSAVDFLIGNDVANTLNGGASNDALDGGVGNDVLIGGAGFDGFLFTRAAGPANADVVVDFELGIDKVLLDSTVMTALGTGGDLVASDPRFFAASGASAGHDADDRIVYDTANGRLYYDADGSGAGAAQLIATFQGAPALAPTDISVITSSSGGFTFNGTVASDSLLGGGGADTLRGFAGNDTLDGAWSDDLLEAGDGNDTLFGGPGIDTLDGGLGNDTYIVTTRRDAADVIRDAGGIDFVQADGSWTLSDGLENLAVSAPGDVLIIRATGNALGNVITRIGEISATVILDGGEGNDTLIGSPFGETFEFGAASGNYGTDVIDGGDGGDNISFLDGFFVGSNTARSAVVIDLRAGTLTGGGTGGSGSATIANVENAYGGAFADLLIAHDGHTITVNGMTQTAGARVSGEGGDDTLIGGALSDVLKGGSGSDTFGFDRTPVVYDIIEDFVSGTDRIQIDASVLSGMGASGTFGAGDERFHTAAGATSAHDASDRLIFDTSGRFLWYDADGIGGVAAQRLAFLVGSGPLAAADISVINGSAPPSSQTITGTAAGETLTGGTGNDTISGLGGNDSLIGGTGNDSLDGGAGTDTLNGGDGDDTYVVTAGDVLVDSGGVDTVVSDSSWTLAEGFENLTLSSTAAINATGNSVANVFIGNSAGNSLNGAAGNDVLTGGGGADRFVFSAAPGAANADRISDFASGADRIVLDGAVHAGIGASGSLAAGDARFFAGAGANSGQDASDRVVYNTSTGQLWYDADGSGAGAAQLIATLQGIPTLLATDIEVINGSSSGGQPINGTAGNDTLTGTAGNDTLNGLGGNDTLIGSGGTDSYDGGAGIDTLDLRTSAAVAVNFAAGTISGGFSGTFVNMERVLGSNAADSIIGASGNQNLSGRLGNDTLAGGVGNDTLWGGGGDADSFVFREMGTANADRIGDFASGADRLQLDDAAFTAIGALGNFAAADGRFWAAAGATAGHDANDRVVFNTTTGSLYYDADGSGAGAAHLIATVQAGGTVAATDITVI